jgi:ribose transport system substrate-binding protein
MDQVIDLSPPDERTSLSKMHRFNSFLAAGLLAGLLLSASLIHAKDFTVGLSWNAKESELVQKWEDYLILEGKSQGEPAGINFKWVINVANGDPARQAANIEDLINQGVNLIIARAEDSAAIGASIRAASSAGIPFITFDRASSSDKPTAHVGGDSYDQAKTTAEAFVALLKANNVQGKCIELQGALTDINAVNRSKGWHDVTDKSGVVVTVVSVPTEWNPELFRSGATNALRAHPEANCMFIASDFCFSAVQSALEGAGHWAPRGDTKHVWLATQDVFPEAEKAMENGFVDLGTSYDAYFHAREAIRVAVLLAKGEKPDCGPDGCLVKGRLVTQENVKTMPNLWSRPTN